MRYSRQRELILRTVAALGSHPTAEQIHAAARAECPALSLGTVYRDLNQLAAAGLLRRVTVSGQADRFDHTLAPHGHWCCTRCGRVTDLSLEPPALLALLPDGEGRVEDVALTVYGVCPVCLAEEEAEG